MFFIAIMRRTCPVNNAAKMLSLLITISLIYRKSAFASKTNVNIRLTNINK